MRWTTLPFAELSPFQLYDLLALRSAVFVVEQNCVFQDPDGLDSQAWHLLGHDEDGALAAYARLLPPGVKAPEAVIGRVITSAAARGSGQGRQLMSQAVAGCERLWPSQPITLHAQARLEGFYASFGFVTVSAPYIEDGIPHIEMRKTR
jgi:ElaA protein